MERYQVTGNEYLSFPTLRQTDAAIEGMTFLYMAAKGMIELKAMQTRPFCGLRSPSAGIRLR